MSKATKITRRYRAALARILYYIRGEIPLDSEGGLPTGGRLLNQLEVETVEEMIATGEVPQPGAEDEIIFRSGGEVLIGPPINRGWLDWRARNS